MDTIKQNLEKNLPIDLKITHKLKPRQAMFPYFPTAHREKFDDYGEVIDIKSFKRMMKYHIVRSSWKVRRSLMKRGITIFVITEKVETKTNNKPIN